MSKELVLHIILQEKEPLTDEAYYKKMRELVYDKFKLWRKVKISTARSTEGGYVHEAILDKTTRKEK